MFHKGDLTLRTYDMLYRNRMNNAFSIHVLNGYLTELYYPICKKMQFDWSQR